MSRTPRSRGCVKKTGERYSYVTYGVTSLSPEQADPRELLKTVRGHWQIENGSHYRRDVTFNAEGPLGEDGCDLRRRPVAHIMSILNNIATGLKVAVLGAIALAGFKNSAQARRTFAEGPFGDARPVQAIALLVST